MPKPFDPLNPADALAETFRRQVTDIMIAAPNHPAYRACDPIQQVESFMGGVLTGLIGVLFSHIRPEGRDEIMQAIATYLPQARQNAEAMVDDALG